jgi:hypothetical protein
MRQVWRARTPYRRAPELEREVGNARQLARPPSLGKVTLFIEPCLPTISRAVPTGRQWAYEIKHDGFRFLAVRERVRVYSRNAWIAVGNTARRTSRESFCAKQVKMLVLTMLAGKRPRVRLRHDNGHPPFTRLAPIGVGSPIPVCAAVMVPGSAIQS